MRAPNILYIVIDDIGFGALDSFGGLIEAPSITRLADGGLRYTNFHTTAVGSRTRACLLTGRNRHSVGTGTIREHGRRLMDQAAIAGILHPYGYASFAVGKWHYTPGAETETPHPFDRWPDGPLFGFDRFRGCHLSEDVAEKSLELLSAQHSTDPEKPWLCYLAFGACHAPQMWKSCVDTSQNKFDMGWDRYREQVLERQKQMGVVPQHTELAPMLDGIPKWEDLSQHRQKLLARAMETYAAFMSHADAQIARLVNFLERTGQLDDTLIFVIIGDNGTCAKLDGPNGWALAMNTPFKAHVRFGSTRNPMIVHWPQGIEARDETRTQFHHAIDIVPTTLQAIGVEVAPWIDGASMTYSFDDADAETSHPTQHFEMLGKRAIIARGWKAVTYHDRKSWEDEVAWSFDHNHWELYDLELDPSECHDLAAEKDVTRFDDPIVKKLFQLVGLWWAEAGRSTLGPDQRTMRASPEAIGEAARGDER